MVKKYPNGIKFLLITLIHTTFTLMLKISLGNNISLVFWMWGKRDKRRDRKCTNIVYVKNLSDDNPRNEIKKNKKRTINCIKKTKVENIGNNL